jgi:taurine dioxygenase
VFGKESLKREPLLQLRDGLTTTEGDKETVHPVVCTHEESGRKHLFVNLTYTQRFEGMTQEESRPLIEYLCNHAARPEFGCRLRWKNNTVVIWDNRCTMHRAIPDFLESFRYLERTTIAGLAPHR